MVKKGHFETQQLWSMVQYHIGLLGILDSICIAPRVVHYGHLVTHNSPPYIAEGGNKIRNLGDHNAFRIHYRRRVFTWNGIGTVITCSTNYAFIVAINMESSSRECVV